MSFLRVVLLASWIGLVLSAEEYDSDGVKIRYIIRGEGDPVVLIHGLGASARLNWDLPGVIDLLAKDYHVIALDCRGHGASKKPEGVENYGEEMVEDVVRLLDHLKIEKAHLVGYSMGGMISMKLAVTHPDRVLSVVLGGMGMMEAGSPAGRFWEVLPDRGAVAPEGCVQGFAELAVTEREVKVIDVPVSIVVGDRDPVRWVYVGPLQRVRPEWEVRLVQGAGHLDCVLKKEFRDAIRDFLGRHVRQDGR